MYRTIVRGLLLILAFGLFSLAGFAEQIPVGFFTWDMGFIAPGSGAFDITNETGPNAGDPFPISTTVDLSSLSLTVDFLNSPSPVVFGSSYFHLSLDGISFDGSDLLQTYPDGPIDATLTGVFNELGITLLDSTTRTILPDFSATLISSSGADFALNDQDSQIIYATSVPEPGTWILLGSGFLGVVLMRRKRLSRC